MDQPVGIVFLDVDDILLDFQGYGVEYVRKHLNALLPEGYRPQVWSGEDLGIAWKELIPLMQPGCNRDLVALPGAAELTNWLMNAGFRVVLITKIQSNWELRMQNLRTQGIRYDEIYFCPFSQGKSVFVNEVLARFKPKIPWLFLDDNYTNCLEVATASPLWPGVVLQLDLPYNRLLEQESPDLRQDRTVVMWSCSTLANAFKNVEAWLWEVKHGNPSYTL